MLQALNQSEISVQLDAARNNPRDINRALMSIKAMATLDKETALSCFYHLERRGKQGVQVIDGVSVRLAEIIASCWGNLRVQTRIVGNDGRMVTAQGICHDLETNVAVSVEVKRSIVGKYGTFSEDMQVVTGNAAAAIAYRNAVLKVVPSAITKKVTDEIRKSALGSIVSIEQEWQRVVDWFTNAGATVNELFSYISRADISQVTNEHILTLQSLANAIHEGSTTIDEAFGRKSRAAKQVLDEITEKFDCVKVEAKE